MLPVHLFISFAERDVEFVGELEAHLGALRQRKLVAYWHRGLLRPGSRVDQSMEENLHRSSIVLILVTPDYLWKHHPELERLARLASGGVRVIPVLVRPCDIEGVTLLQRLHCLPAGYPASQRAVAERSASRPKFITDWPTRDEAWVNVVEGIQQVLTPRAPAERDPRAPPGGDQDQAVFQVERQAWPASDQSGASDRPTLVSVSAAGGPRPRGAGLLLGGVLFFFLAIGCLAAAVWILFEGRQQPGASASTEPSVTPAGPDLPPPSPPTTRTAKASSTPVLAGAGAAATSGGSCPAPCVAGAQCRVDSMNVGDEYGLCKAGAVSCAPCFSERACVRGARGDKVPEGEHFRLVASKSGASSYDQVCLRLHGGASWSCLRAGTEESFRVSVGQLTGQPGLDVELRAGGATVAGAEAVAVDSVDLYALCVGLKLKVAGRAVLFHVRDP